jgi:O-antigen ligase
MRVYGTMGNPDFVAAWCCATLPFCWYQIARGGGSRILGWAAAGLQVAAILATGSRVFALILPLQAAMLALRWKPMRRAWPLALPVAAALLFLAPTRPLNATVEGRLYLARVTANYFDGPLTGHGPGSFEGRFAVWQAAWFEDRRNAEDVRFAGPVDHAHNDYLEILVEYGPSGLAAFLALAAWIAARAWRGRAQPVSNAQTAAAIGAVSLLAIAIVDFPFHRPAEWGLFWLLSGFLSLRDTKTQENSECRLQPNALRTLES